MEVTEETFAGYVACEPCVPSRRTDTNAMHTSAQWPSGLLLSSLANACRTGHAAYLLVFSSSRRPADGRYAHAFASFVRTWGEGPHEGSYSLEVQTISWLPATRRIDPHRALSERGENLNLHATLHHVLGQGQSLALWGPWAIDPGLYDLACVRVRRLASGLVRFQAHDDGQPPGRVCNAVHAISDVVEDWSRLSAPLASLGTEAGVRIARHFRRYLLAPDEAHPWLEERLGLWDYPLEHHPFLEAEAPPRRRRAGKARVLAFPGRRASAG